MGCQDPSVSKSNQLHVDTFQVSIITLKVYSVELFKMMDTSTKIMNLNHIIFQTQPTLQTRRSGCLFCDGIASRGLDWQSGGL